MPATKTLLYQACQTELKDRIADLQAAVVSINVSKQNETKSSAGDKYETGRAMMQMEQDKITARLEQAQHMLSKLQQIKLEKDTASVSVGSMVTTDQRTYFLSVSLGKVTRNGQAYFCLSAEAPVGKLLLGKSVGEEIVFNGRREKILTIN